MPSNSKTYNSEIHHRRSIRLKGYDYSQEGLYFVTICVHDRECLLGEVKNGEMILNEYGKMVEYTWHDLPNHNPNIQLGAYCTMPNHIHGIIEIIPNPNSMIVVRAGSKPALDSDFPNNKRADLESAQMDSDTTIIKRADLESAPTDATDAMDIEMNDDAPVRAGSKPALGNIPLSEIIRQFKTFSARRINKQRATPGISVWQRNYYEHIIRHQNAYENITNYIETNPARWNNDKFFQS